MSLRKTVMVLYKLEKATADDLANETKRLRAVESASANQLVRMGYLKKRREGREVYFYIESPMEMRK
jgi:predicted transcriptional regulator